MLCKTQLETTIVLQARVLSPPKEVMVRRISTRELTCKATVEATDLKQYRSASRIDRHPALLPRALVLKEVTSQSHKKLLSSSLLISLVSPWLASSVDQELHRLEVSARAMQQVLSLLLPWLVASSLLHRQRIQLRIRHSRLSQRL